MKGDEPALRAPRHQKPDPLLNVYNTK